jgi:hypothetical protein
MLARHAAEAEEFPMATKSRQAQKKPPAKRSPAAPAQGTAARKPPPAKRASDHSEAALSPERHAELATLAHTLQASLLIFPGRLDQRTEWSTRIRIAAERDAADLVKTPFHDEPMITPEEIQAQRDKIEFLRAAESGYQAMRAGKEAADAEFDQIAPQAASDRELLLRALELRFKNDLQGQKRVAKIREGAGDADLVQDISDVLVLCEENKDFLAKCPRGEQRAVARLEQVYPRLTHLLSAKALSSSALEARKLRDGAYTMVMNAERRFRAAADYWYRGTEKAKEYAAFVPSDSDGPRTKAPSTPR